MSYIGRNEGQNKSTPFVCAIVCDLNERDKLQRSGHVQLSQAFSSFQKHRMQAPL